MFVLFNKRRNKTNQLFMYIKPTNLTPHNDKFINAADAVLWRHLAMQFWLCSLSEYLHNGRVNLQLQIATIKWSDLVLMWQRAGVTVVDSGNYTCEIRTRESNILGGVTHSVFVRGKLRPSLMPPGSGSGEGVPRAVAPTFTNGLARRAPWVEEQQKRNWRNCTDHHESAHQND